jgi:hypothetical protein
MSNFLGYIDLIADLGSAEGDAGWARKLAVRWAVFDGAKHGRITPENPPIEAYAVVDLTTKQGSPLELLGTAMGLNTARLNPKSLLGHWCALDEQPNDFPQRVNLEGIKNLGDSLGVTNPKTWLLTQETCWEGAQEQLPPDLLRRLHSSTEWQSAIKKGSPCFTNC